MYLNIKASKGAYSQNISFPGMDLHIFTNKYTDTENWIETIRLVICTNMYIKSMKFKNILHKKINKEH